MPLIAIVKESGGCDYTIGCGIECIEIPQAIESFEDAEQWLYDTDRLYGTNGNKLTVCTIYKTVETHKVDLNVVYEVAKKRHQQKELDQKTAAQAALLAQLTEGLG